MWSADRWLIRSSTRQFRENAGAKARGLYELERSGFEIPSTWAITYEAHDAYRADGEKALRRLRKELESLPGGWAWAVRSSADVEDQVGASYAGQFTSVLRVKGIDALVGAVEATWTSADAPKASGYANIKGDTGSGIRMGVLIQQMIEPVFSGVSFSCDPVTCRRQVVIEAVRGSGEGLVQQGLQPLGPGADELPEEIVARLKKGTAAMALKLGMEVDIEWAYDGDKLWWLQARPVTTCSKVTVYSNRMSKEMLPGAVKPLVWSVNIPLINGAWIRIFEELTGRKDLDPFALSRMFHYRVYFNMGEIGKIWSSMGLPPDSLEQLTIEGMGKGMKMRISPRTAACLPRIARFGFGKLGWLDRTATFIGTYGARCRSMMSEDLSSLSDSEIMGRYEELYLLNREGAYRNIITILLTAMFTSVLKRALEKHGEDLETVEWNRQQKEQMECYPDSRLAELGTLYASLPPEERSMVNEQGSMRTTLPDDSAAFHRELKRFLEQFGHLSESGNDLTRPPWRENPYDLLAIIRGHGGDRPRPERKTLEEVEPSAMRRLFIEGVASRASRYSVLKERMSSTYALGYGLFRPLFIELGDRLCRRGALDRREDIFFLYMDELRETLSSKGGDLRPIVASRQEEIARVGDLPLPETIYGEEPPPHVCPTARLLKGLATSRGYYRGRTRIVRSISDFDRVKSGDVIVIPYSDVSWSSIFSRASAVISESGGMLSHGSILAREYGIPSVTSVPNAMALPDGAEVVVDGFKGHVYLDPGAAGL